jgi:4-amino-4-deoxy-L-arabinose transferase-like glycosyltransferase
MIGRAVVKDWLGRHPDLAALALVGLVAGLVRWAFLYRAPVFLSGDSQSHFLPGFDLVRGFDFDPELRRPPGYAAFAAGVIVLLGEDLRALALAQHILGVATALLTFWLGRLTFGRAAGLAGGLLVALDGALILSEHSVMTETLFGALLLATLVLLVLAARRGQWAWCLAAGVALGAATLTRPVGQILIPLVPLAFLLAGGKGRNALRGSILVGVGFLLVVGPWTVRNLTTHGSLTASGGLGRSLVARTIKYDEGFFEDDRPTAGPDDLQGRVRQFVRGKRNTIRNSRSVRSTQAGLIKELGLTQAESDRLMRQVALEAIAERPGYYTLGSLRMAGQIAVGRPREDGLLDRWNDRANKDWVEQWEDRIDHLVTPLGLAEQREYGAAEVLVSIYRPAALGPIVPALAALGLGVAALVAPFRPALVPGLAALAILLASAALDGPVPRYRYPLDPLFALFAAGGAIASLTAGRSALARLRGSPSAHRAGSPVPAALRVEGAQTPSPSGRGLG